VDIKSTSKIEKQNKSLKGLNTMIIKNRCLPSKAKIENNLNELGL
jgi:hypothetical protein